jgi:hypothetical protein
MGLDRTGVGDAVTGGAGNSGTRSPDLRFNFKIGASIRQRPSKLAHGGAPSNIYLFGFVGLMMILTPGRRCPA